MKIKHITKRIFAIAAAAVLSSGMLGSFAAPIQVKAEEASQASGYRNVMYYGDWSIWGGQGMFYPKGIPADQLTHLNFAFLDFDANGELMFTDKDAATGAPVGMDGVTWGAANAGILNAMQDLRAKNPNLKIGVSLGGWSKSGDFSTVSANESVRKHFVDNVMKFIKYTNMDFVDVDWEYPGSVREADKVDNKNDEGTLQSSPADMQNYIALLKDLRAALDAQGAELGRTYELSVAISASKATLTLGTDIPQLFDTVDFVNVMTYDMHGAWDEISGHQTGLYTNPDDPAKDSGLSVDDAVTYLLANGAKADKIVIGAAFYTRGWQKVAPGGNEALPGLFQPAELCTMDADQQTKSRGANNEAPLKEGEGGRMGGVWSYRSIDKLKAAYPGLTEYWDDTAKAPYLYSKENGAFFTFDNVRSVKEKAAYVKAKGLGGMISWMASQDAETNVSGQRDELTKAIKEGLYGSAPLKQHTLPSSNLDVTVTVETFNEEWTRSEGYAITITNNAKKDESNEVLNLVEIAGETIKSPMLYIRTKSGAEFSPSGYGSGTIKNENGCGIIDLTSVSDGQTIAPGASYSFQIKSSNKAELDDIITVELAQRIVPGSAEISRQLVYGEYSDAPFILGVSDKEIQVGDSFDPLEGITATDSNDGVITSSITFSGSVDTQTEGIYELTYSVTNKAGKTTTAVCKITVSAKSENPQPDNNAYDNNKIYFGGEIVTYEGKTYKCKWWTQGTPPGSADGPWELIEASAAGTEDTPEEVTGEESIPAEDAAKDTVVDKETTDDDSVNDSVTGDEAASDDSSADSVTDGQPSEENSSADSGTDGEASSEDSSADSVTDGEASSEDSSVDSVTDGEASSEDSSADSVSDKEAADAAIADAEIPAGDSVTDASIG